MCVIRLLLCLFFFFFDFSFGFCHFFSFFLRYLCTSVSYAVEFGEVVGGGDGGGDGGDAGVCIVVFPQLYLLFSTGLCVLSCHVFEWNAVWKSEYSWVRVFGWITWLRYGILSSKHTLFVVFEAQPWFSIEYGWVAAVCDSRCALDRIHIFCAYNVCA